MGFSAHSAAVLKPGGLYTPLPYGPSHHPGVPIIGRSTRSHPGTCQPMTNANNFKASILNFDATKRNMNHLQYYLVVSQLYLIPSPDEEIIHLCPILSQKLWLIRRRSLTRIPEPLHDPYCNALEYVWWWPAIGSSRTVLLSNRIYRYATCFTFLHCTSSNVSPNDQQPGSWLIAAGYPNGHLYRPIPHPTSDHHDQSRWRLEREYSAA